jgi:hypothetical protein
MNALNVALALIVSRYEMCPGVWFVEDGCCMQVRLRDIAVQLTALIG